MAAAWEIARELSLAGAEDEAALFGGGVTDSVALIRIVPGARAPDARLRAVQLECRARVWTWIVVFLSFFALCVCVCVTSAYRVWPRGWWPRFTDFF